MLQQLVQKIRGNRIARNADSEAVKGAPSLGQPTEPIVYVGIGGGSPDR